MTSHAASIILVACAVVFGTGGVVLLHSCRPLELSPRSACAWALVGLSAAVVEAALHDSAPDGLIVGAVMLASITLYILALPARFKQDIKDVLGWWEGDDHGTRT